RAFDWELYQALCQGVQGRAAALAALARRARAAGETLASLHLHAALNGAVNVTALDTPPRQPLGVSTNVQVFVEESRSVLGTLAADYADRSALNVRSQYSLQSTISTDSDSAADTVEYDPTAGHLDTVYLCEELLSAAPELAERA